MDKLKYILKLNNIRFTDAAKAEINEKLTRDATDKKQKKRRESLAVFGAVAGSVVFFALSVALIFIMVNRHPTGSLDPIDPGVVPVEDDVIPVEDDGYISVSPLFYNDTGYDLLIDTVSRVKVTEDGEFITTGDHFNFYKYFNVNSITADSLCRTMFAGYDGNLFLFDPNTYAVPDGYEKYNHKEHGKYYDRNSAKADFKSSYMTINGVTAGTAEVIALSASHGTFRYLLTFTFLYPAATSSTRAPVYGTEIPENTILYNGTGEEIGYYDGQFYRIVKDKLNTVKVTIYKTRTENGIPVIYGSRVVSPDEYLLDPGLYYSGSWMQEGFTTISITLAYDSKPPKIQNLITGGVFSFYNCRVQFDNSEKSTSILHGGAWLSEFPYSMPDCRKSGLISNSTLCTIITAYDLQWFFPTYVYEDEKGQITVIGSAVGKQITNHSTYSPFSSTLFPLIGGDNDNGIFCDFVSGEQVDPYYDPYVCDKPYFKNKSGLDKLTLFKITITTDNEIIGPETAGKLSEELYFTEQSEIPEYQTEINMPYIEVKDRMCGTPTAPYSVYTAPFAEEYEGDAYLFYKLGLKAPEIKYVDTTDFSPMVTVAKKIRITDISDKEKTLIGKNTYDKTTISAYEISDKYIFDTNGAACAYIADGRVYYFNTSSPEFNITVISDNGTLLYIGAGDFRYIENDATETDPFEMTPSGLPLGAYMYAPYLWNGDNAPLKSVEYDGDKVTVSWWSYFDTPEFYINCGDRREYYYRGGFVKAVYENKTEWGRINDGYTPYYVIYEMRYDGHELMIKCSDVIQEENHGYSK